MAKKNDAIYDRLIKVGLQDPFMRGIAGVVLIATAASLAISALGSGTKDYRQQYERLSEGLRKAGMPD
jgi:hypothetical protein